MQPYTWPHATTQAWLVIIASAFSQSTQVIPPYQSYQHGLFKKNFAIFNLYIFLFLIKNHQFFLTKPWLSDIMFHHRYSSCRSYDIRLRDRRGTKGPARGAPSQALVGGSSVQRILRSRIQTFGIPWRVRRRALPARQEDVFEQKLVMKTLSQW